MLYGSQNLNSITHHLMSLIVDVQVIADVREIADSSNHTRCHLIFLMC